MVRRSLAGLMVAFVLFGTVAAWAQPDAANAFAQGKLLLTRGDLAGALAAFKSATKTEPENQQYFQEYSLLKRVLDIRDQVKNEQDADAWAQMNRALYNYYTSYKINGEALAIAQVLHERLHTGETATMLAAAQIAAGKDADAAALLAALPAEQRAVDAQVLLGLAQAHLGQMEAARTTATNIELPKNCDGQICFHAARLFALAGEPSRALSTLRCAFECTPPNSLAALKTDVRECRDLAGLASGAEFAKVLETASKMPAGCGSGKSCGGCSKAKTCGTAGAKESEQPAGDKAQGGCQHGK